MTQNLTVEIAKQLEVDEEIQLTSPMQGMTAEPLRLRLTEKGQTSSGSLRFVFAVSYFGISLGKRFLFIQKSSGKEIMIWAE